MLRWVVTASVFASAAPAAAEDWWHVGIGGEAPLRRHALFDAASIDRTDPAIPRVKLALRYETPDEDGIAMGVATYALDCRGASYSTVFVEVRDAAGTVLGSEALEGGSFTAINPNSYFDVLRLAVCEDQWQWDGAYQFGEGKTLNELSGAVF